MYEDPTRSIVRLALERVIARSQRCAPEADGAAPLPPPLILSGGPASGPESKDEPQPAGLRGFPGDVALASDHGGFALKEHLVAALRERGYRVRDLGPPTDEACDYPDFALRVAKAVAKGDAWRGIMVDGIGIGSAMAAGKVPGVRAATCFDKASTVNSRAHNDGNVLCIGSRVLEPEQGLELALLFLETAFEGGRHARRVEKIVAIEQAFTAPLLAMIDGGGGS